MITLDSILARCKPAGTCLEWNGLRNKAGYGRIYLPDRERRRRMEYTHRAVALVLGWPIDNRCVLHKCDNPPCCNPDHLFLGSHGDNVHDAMNKGHHVSPPVTDWPNKMLLETHHWQVLSYDDVAAIRKRLALGEKQKSIAQDFGVSFQQISKIKLGRRWAHFK